MRILITTGIFYPDIGGPASYARNIGERLQKNDHQVTVLTYSNSLSDKNDSRYGFKVVRVWRKIPKPFRHLLYYFKARSLAGSHDIVYSLNAVSAGLPSLWATKSAKKKFFVRVVGDYSWEIAAGEGKTSLVIDDFQNSEKSGKILRLSKIQTKVCSQADGIIVPSKYLAEMVENWGVSKDKIHVVYNGVDVVKPELTREEARKKVGIPGSIILSAGRFVPWKGFKMLIKIMPRLLEINQFFRLVIIGDGPEEKVLDQMVKNMGLQNKVFLVGKKSKEEIAVYSTAADMFVLNSGYEGFSHHLIESMAFGLPVIASAMGGNKELIKQGDNGFLVKYNDEFNLVEAIKGLWQHEEIRDIFIKEGLKTVSKYSSERMYKETVKILES